MTTSDFWQAFSQQEFSTANMLFKQLSEEAQIQIFKQLFQQSGHQKMPFMLSVLERTLDEDKNFNDFYQAWLPPQSAQKPVDVAGEHYLQTFPVPVRVLNGIDLNDSQRVISVGITWIKNAEQEQQLMEYLQKAKQGDDDINETRHDEIDKVADGKLLGLFKIESDDNLGGPF